MTYQIKKIGKGLFKISSPLGVRYFHQYVLVENDNAIIIDTGMQNTPVDVLEPALRDIGMSLSQIRNVIISHADVDHFSGTEKLKEKSKQVTVMAHKLDASWIESKEKILTERYFRYEQYGVFHDNETKKWFKNELKETNVDVQLNGGEVLHLGADRYIDVIHTPGHTQGHLSFYDRKNRAAIVVDAILWKGLYDTEKRIVSPPPYYDIDNYIDSIKKIMSLDIDVLLTGHYDRITGKDIQSFLNESIEFVTTVGDTVLEVIESSNKPLTLREILEKTNEKTGNFTVMMVELVGPIFMHLIDLEACGKVVQIETDPFVSWTTSK